MTRQINTSDGIFRKADLLLKKKDELENLYFKSVLDEEEVNEKMRLLEDKYNKTLSDQERRQIKNTAKAIYEEYLAKLDILYDQLEEIKNVA